MVTCVAEPPLLVRVVVGCRCAPHPAVRPSIFGALGVQLLHEGEGEQTHVAVICHYKNTNKQLKYKCFQKMMMLFNYYGVFGSKAPHVLCGWTATSLKAIYTLSSQWHLIFSICSWAEWLPCRAHIEYAWTWRLKAYFFLNGSITFSIFKQVAWTIFFQSG